MQARAETYTTQISKRADHFLFDNFLSYLQILQNFSTPPSPKEPDVSSNEPDSSSVPILLSKTSLNMLPPPKPKVKLPATEDERDETLLKSFAMPLLARMGSFKSKELTILSTIESTAEALQMEPGSCAFVTGGREVSRELVPEVQLIVVAIVVVIVEEEFEAELFKILGAKSSRVAIYKRSSTMLNKITT